jgi:PAS domain S-box-containing protein
MPQSLYYLLPLGISTAISTAIALFVWQRRSAPGTTPFVLSMLAAAEWSLAYALSLVSPSLAGKVFWIKVRYIGIVTVPTAWLTFALLQTGLGKWVTRRTLILLLIEPLAILLLVWTNEWHKLYWADIHLVEEGPIVGIDVLPGLFYWIHVAYSYLLVATSSLLFVRMVIRSPSPYRSQSIVILAGVLGPLVGDAISTFSLNPFLPWLDLTPFFFTLTGLAMVWGVFRLRMLDIVPVARDAVIENMSDGVIIVDARDRVIDLNPAARTMLNCTAPEAIGQPASKVLPDWPYQIDGHSSVAITRAQAEGPTQRYFEIRVSPLYERRDGSTGHLIILRDATERKQTETALRDSEHKYRVLVEQSLQGFGVIKDMPFQIVFANSALAEILGYSVDELLHLSPEAATSLIHPDDWELFSQHYSACLEGEESAPRYQLRVIRKDGSARWVEILASCTEYQGESAMQAAFIDVTARKRIEEALLQRNRELELLNRASQALSSTLDLDQVLMAVLEEVRRLMGVDACSVWLTDPETGELTCQQATGPQREILRTWHLLPGEGIAGWAASKGQSLIVPDIWADERRYYKFNEEIGLPLRSILTTPLRVKDRVVGVLQVLDSGYDRFDTTDLMMLEPLATTAAIAIENARLYEQARQDAETRATLLREVNHRAKNNLSAIIGLLYAARRRAGIENESTHRFIMNDLINRLQGLATLYSLLSASEWTPLLLCEVAAWVIRSCLQTLSSQRWVSVDVEPSPVKITPDQAHDLTLVINELATNTVKHSLQEENSSGHITVRIAQDDDIITFTFRDNGPGYPDEVIQEEGGNVGLDLIRNIVRHNLHGDLSLYNDSGAVASIQFKAKS